MKDKMIGKRFGNLIVTEQIPRPNQFTKPEKWYLCQCDCGGTKKARGSGLRMGSPKSCGCKTKISEYAIKTGKKKCTKCKKVLPISEFWVYKPSRSEKPKVNTRCKQCFNEKREEYSSNSRNRIREEGKRSIRKLKDDVFIHYGGSPPSCACCGETFHMFLTIDHIDGKGRHHREEIKRTRHRTTSSGFYRWLRQHNYPPGYRVLCFNCNYAVHLFGQDISLLQEALHN